jgi:hypothetical protein
MWGDDTALVQSYGDVIARYSTHPEAKSLGPDGGICGQRTVRLLQRRPVVLGELVHIGKETNRLEEVEQGKVYDWDVVQLVVRKNGNVPTRANTDCMAAQLTTLACNTYWTQAER